tara:strand:- start:927 stop:1130 length:204 start_codon:yes stop_codon:yes gene_type:complete
MSGEQITSKELNETLVDKKPQIKNKRVNINDLLGRIREENTKQKKENYMYVGIVVGVLAVTGVIASL